jgi:hypothetical protein
MVTAPDHDDTPVGPKFNKDTVMTTCVTTGVFYPITVGKTLMQLGYEPMTPQLTHTVFGTPKLAYPNIFKYLDYIRNEDGWSGLYRGFGYKLMFALVEQGTYVYAYNNIDEWVQKVLRDKVTIPGLNGKQSERNEFEQAFREMSCKLVSITVSYPISLMMVRSIAEFVGRETIYNSLPICLSRLLHERNLYSGLKPRLILELYSIFLFHMAKYALKHLFTDQTILPTATRIAQLLASGFLYPYELCSTVLAVNSCSSLLASRIDPHYFDWNSCLATLAARNQLKRGSSILWRHQPINMQSY